VGRRLHPDRVRPLPRHRAPLGPGRLGWLRLLPLAHPLVLGLRLHLVCTLHGLPVAFALANPKADEREVLVELLEVEAGLLAERPGLVLLVDKGYRDAETEAILAAQGVRVLRPAYKGEAPRPGQGLFKPLRQLIESVNDTLKANLTVTAGGPSRASPSGCCSGCWP
jgi:hypothetical protein